MEYWEDEYRDNEDLSDEEIRLYLRDGVKTHIMRQQQQMLTRKDVLDSAFASIDAKTKNLESFRESMQYFRQYYHWRVSEIDYQFSSN